MAKEKFPTEGGRYLRNKNGSLKKVEPPKSEAKAETPAEKKDAD